MEGVHILSSSVGLSLRHALARQDIDAIADAFVEMYVQAMVGMGNEAYARGVDDIARQILDRGM